MAKSNRRKKQDRARAEARRAVQARRKARREEGRAFMEHFAGMVSPQTPPAEVAALLMAEFAGSAIGGVFARSRLHEGVPVEQVAETARLLLAAEAPGIGALTFAAALAHHAGDEDEEHRHTAEALALASAGKEDDAGTWLEVLDFIASDHAGEAIEPLEPYLAAEPDHERAGEIYAAALERAYRAAEPTERERAALDRFADRSALSALRDEFAGFLDRTEWGQLVARKVAEDLALVADVDWPAGDLDAFANLCSEIASRAVSRDGDEGAQRETPLRAFAADPSLAPEQAARASAWRDHAYYGVWQIADPVAAPGLWCTDLVSGRRLYVQFPAEVLAEAPPWTVWLGALLPVDGIWRCIGTGSMLSPVEADAVAEFVDLAVETVRGSLSGTPRDKLPKPRPLRFGKADPYGQLWEYQDPPGPQYAAFARLVTAELITQLTADVARYRTTPPALRTSDDEPMVLIDATIAVRGDVAQRLTAHPDFGLDHDEDPSRIVWWGKPVPSSEIDAALAELRAQGYEPEIDSGKPQRWTRGKLTLADGTIRAAVNSEGRLDRLVRILRKLGAEPVVTDQKRIDPALDYAWLSGSVPAIGTTPPAADGWEKAWLEDHVPALRGRTPRQAAAGSDEDRIYLESLLRQFEYQAGLAALDGHRGIDVAWLRQELDMPDERARVARRHFS